MDNGNLRRLSLGHLRTALQQNTEEQFHAYINQNVGVVKSIHPSIIGSLTEQPFILDEMRVLIVKQGGSRPVINLLPVDVTAGDLLFIGKNSTVMMSGLSDGTEGEGFTITDELFRLAMGPALPPSLDGHVRHFKISLTADEQGMVTRFIDLLYDSIRRTECSSRVFLSLAASFLWYIDSLYNTHVQHSSRQTDRDQDVFSRFISLVNEYARTHHTLDFYADRLCLSLRYMGTLVKQVSGRSAKEWIDEALVTAIKVELRHTAKPLKQIADETAFPNMSFFSKFFKRMTGLTPNEYRRTSSQ